MPDTIVTPDDFEKNAKGEIVRKKEESKPTAKNLAEAPENVDMELYEQQKKKAEEAAKYD